MRQTSSPGYRASALCPLLRPLLLALLLAALVLGASACRGDEENAEGTAPGGEGALPPGASPTLVCSEECANRGQCGESPERGMVVLLSQDGPALDVTAQELAFPVNTMTEVRETVSRTAQDGVGNTFPVTFYRVFIPDRGAEAWVAQWCIANATQ